ncbi:MAG: oxygen-independent coproporphyrinogen-3 oxidase [Gammaproteobacteria bacterium]|jgi:oxygen-independent coproporphyrinogen-3 oxidase
MNNNIAFDKALIKRYDLTGPRYTSYPPVTQFSNRIDNAIYQTWAQASNEELIPRPLSLYFHIPFCDTICYYCACNKVVTKNKQRSVEYLEDLFREIELQSALYDSDRIVEQLHWGGGTPTFLTNDQMRALMDKIRQHFKLHDEGQYSIEIDPRSIEQGSIEHLRRLGFNRISIGVQDFDPKVQIAVNRVQSVEMTATVIDNARRSGFKSINVDLIYGLPFQTVTSFAQTLNTLIDLKPDRIAVYNYAHLPHRFPPQRRIDEDSLPRPEEKLEILRFTIERLTQAGYVYIGMDHFALPDDELAVAQRNGTLHRNFQGYSSHAQCDSVAMGVSAISNVGDHFCQNTSDLSAYHDALQKSQLAIIRGCETEFADILRNDIIQQLICHFWLDIGDIEKRWNLDFASYFDKELTRLSAMEQDGLLLLTPDSITILQPGRLLVRSICMVFDRYIDPKINTSLFSRIV